VKNGGFEDLKNEAMVEYLSRNERPNRSSTKIQSVHPCDEPNLGARRMHSHVSIVSLEADTVSIDEESSLADDNFGYQRRKRARRSKKSVHFVDMNLSSDEMPVEVVSIKHKLEFDTENLYWTRKELSCIQREAKMIIAFDVNVRDYVDAFQQCRDRTLKRHNTNVGESLVLTDELPCFVDGLREGWRGLEIFSSSQKSRQIEVRKIVRTVVAAQQDYDLAQKAASLTTLSGEWAQFVGRMEYEMSRT
jgi:hypothetical protein